MYNVNVFICIYVYLWSAHLCPISYVLRNLIIRPLLLPLWFDWSWFGRTCFSSFLFYSLKRSRNLDLKLGKNVFGHFVVCISHGLIKIVKSQAQTGSIPINSNKPHFDNSIENAHDLYYAINAIFHLKIIHLFVTYIDNIFCIILCFRVLSFFFSCCCGCFCYNICFFLLNHLLYEMYDI